MYIGGGIFLLVVGAILSFAISDTKVQGIDLEVIGYICMAGGVLAIVLSLMMMNRARSTSHTAYVERRDVPPTPPPPGY
jgi:predicted membrane channel-forming protein YqfA (hemolysin III family)